MPPIILAIESSCDETSAAIVKNGKVLNNIIATQFEHQNYGGVVPELASRTHQRNIVPVVSKALDSCKINIKQIDAIAFTQGPGLLGSLLVGISFAKGLSLALDKPLIEINHLQAHILAHFIDDPKPEFPFLCLIVSGGHTQIVKVDNSFEMDILGETLDDAVGEAFDKAAKLLGFTYPGGALIDKYAKTGDPFRFKFPKTSVQGFDFSFSGIKTAFLYFLKREIGKDPKFIDNNIHDICAGIQYTLIQMLLDRLITVSHKTRVKNIAIAGGVASNSYLRSQLEIIAEKESWNTYIPKLEYCTDNAAMVAMAAHFKYLENRFSDLKASAYPRLKY